MLTHGPFTFDEELDFPPFDGEMTIDEVISQMDAVREEMDYEYQVPTTSSEDLEPPD